MLVWRGLIEIWDRLLQLCQSVQLCVPVCYLCLRRSYLG